MKDVPERLCKIDPTKVLNFFLLFILLRTFCGNFFNLLLQAIPIYTTHFKVTCNNECYILHKSYFVLLNIHIKSFMVMQSIQYLGMFY